MEQKITKLRSTWFLVRNIATILIALGAFSVANNSFETIVIAGLVLIIINIDAYGRTWGMTQIEKSAPDKKDAEAFDEYSKNKKFIEKRFFISTICAYIIYLITILNLLGAILN
jgi:hypothetical protein